MIKISSSLMKKILNIILIFGLISITQTVQGKDCEPIDIIKKETEFINEKKWDLYGELWSKETNSIISFLKEKNNMEKHLGVFNIKVGELGSIKELPIKKAMEYVPEISNFKNKYKTTAFYIETKYKVFREDRYHINGSNFFVMVLVFEDEKWKILYKAIADTERIISDGLGFGTIEEKTYTKRRMKYYNNKK